MKTVIGILAALAVGGIIVATNEDLRREVQEMFPCCQSAKVSPEQQIAHLQKEIDRVSQNKKKMQDTLAEMKYNLGSLEGEVTKMSDKLDRRQAALLKFATLVKENRDTEFVYAGRNYSPSSAKKELTREYNLFKTSQSALESKQKLLQARQKEFALSMKQYEQFESTIDEYNRTLTNLKTELTELKLDDANDAGISIDNEEFAKIDEGIEKLKRLVGILNEKNRMFGDNSVSPVEVQDEPNSIEPEVVIDQLQNRADKNDVQTVEHK